MLGGARSKALRRFAFCVVTKTKKIEPGITNLKISAVTSIFRESTTISLRRVRRSSYACFDGTSYAAARQSSLQAASVVLPRGWKKAA
jgi:hypothetical protein